jgi:hypothetical protein
MGSFGYAQDDTVKSIPSAPFLVIPKLAEESCDFSRIQTLFTTFLPLPTETKAKNLKDQAVTLRFFGYAQNDEK